MIRAEPKVFALRHKFQDDVWGQIKLNDLERDAIDTPEFQRLLRTSQLGFVDLVYQTANHTRGAHSIGACHIADRLMHHLNQNSHIDVGETPAPSFPRVSRFEEVLIRLGALLHDISHLPFSHDLERKTHRIFYERGKRDTDKATLKLRSHYGHYLKHDDYRQNPLLYILLCNPRKSVLSRVLHYYSSAFYKLLREDLNGNGQQSAHLATFRSLLAEAKKRNWDPESSLLPSLVFHLLTYEDSSEAKDFVRELAVDFGTNGETVRKPWGLGPPELHEQLHNAWYQPFRHDIIGNTLSADLIDYLSRDPQRLGMNRRIDQHLLNYYVLKEIDPSKGWFRCAIDLDDIKRGTSRVGLINDIFRLLDLRQEIHEKAVMHRVVQSANAMMSRSLLLIYEERPRPEEFLRLGEQDHALQSEDTYLERVLEKCDARPREVTKKRKNVEAGRIVRKIVDRSVYRPLMIIPGDRAARHFGQPSQNGQEAGNTEYCLRTLAAIIDSPYYSRFLLFVSGCIEKFLDGVFDGDEELAHYTGDLLSEPPDETVLNEAMGYIPSRVVIWTTPYKQLYKDPGVVVALDNYVERIDNLPFATGQIAKHTSIIDLIVKSIQDADSKYAALWKLYVFISDGLFYSGTLEKLKGKIVGGDPARPMKKHHERKLESAQRWLIAAFDAVYQDWASYCESTGLIQLRGDRLRAGMTSSDFRGLMQLWLALHSKHLRNKGDAISSRLSTVNLGHYVHEDPATEKYYSYCRDIRYRVDLSYQRNLGQDETNEPEPDHKVRAVLEAVGLGSGDVSVLEFDRLKELYDEKMMDQIVPRNKNGNGLNQSEQIAVLKGFWACDFPWPKGRNPLETVARAPVGGAKEIEGAGDNRRNEREIRRWIESEAAILDPRVRKVVNADSRKIAHFIASLNRAHQDRVMENLQTRFSRESQLVWNDIKQGQLLQIIKGEKIALE